MSATYSSERLFSSEAFCDLANFVRSPRPTDESLEDFERQLRERTNAFSAAVMGERLAEMDIDEPQIMIGGEQFRRVGRHEKAYQTLSGEVVIERTIVVIRCGSSRSWRRTCRSVAAWLKPRARPSRRSA